MVLPLAQLVSGPWVSEIRLASNGLKPCAYPRLLRSLGMGAWYGKSNEEECFETLTYAADRGVTFWDTADIYGTSRLLLHSRISFSPDLWVFR